MSTLGSLVRLENVVECQIVGRLNRFVVAVRVNGQERRASTNNTGRLHQFLVAGRTAYCTRPDRVGKTDFRLFAIADGAQAAIIDIQLQMRAFEKAMAVGLLPWLDGHYLVKRNARLGDSMVDYLLEFRDGQLYLEVKSAVLRDNSHAMYPDCPTERGRKHIRQLANYVRSGGRATILFIAALPRVTAFKPYREGDAELCNLLLAAHRAGVTLKSIAMVYDPLDSEIRLTTPDLPVNIQ